MSPDKGLHLDGEDEGDSNVQIKAIRGRGDRLREKGDEIMVNQELAHRWYFSRFQ